MGGREERTDRFGSIRLTPGERRQLEELSRAKDLPMSHLIRLGVKKIIEESQKEPQLVA